MPLSDADRLYRNHCIDAGQKAQDSYDRALLALSGGALGVSLVFLKDIVGTAPIVSRDLLVAAWVCWTGSIVGIVASFVVSQSALRTAVQQVDAGTIRDERPGRWYSRATVTLNGAAGVLFFVGVILMLLFVNDNLGTLPPTPSAPGGSSLGPT